jgi:hypothetical protein
VVCLLEQGMLFTDVAAKFSGCDIAFEVCPGGRQVTGLDCERRRALQSWRDGVSWGVQRRGRYLAGGVVVANVWSLYLPSRLSPGARAALQYTDEPLGPVVRGDGGWREHGSAREVRDRGAIVRSQGLLVVPGPGTSVPVALVWEEALAQLLAGARAPGRTR